MSIVRVKYVYFSLYIFISVQQYNFEKRRRKICSLLKYRKSFIEYIHHKFCYCFVASYAINNESIEYAYVVVTRSDLTGTYAEVLKLS